jgi:hypothetical protein
MPLAKLLGIPARNVMANRMYWQLDDDTGQPKLAGFDPSQPVAHNKGKPAAIRELRRQHPYSKVVMIGDGITDLEAVQETDAADLFIGYGGVVVRACSTYWCRCTTATLCISSSLLCMHSADPPHLLSSRLRIFANKPLPCCTVAHAACATASRSVPPKLHPQAKACRRHVASSSLHTVRGQCE